MAPPPSQDEYQHLETQSSLSTNLQQLLTVCCTFRVHSENAETRQMLRKPGSGGKSGRGKELSEAPVRLETVSYSQQCFQSYLQHWIKRTRGLASTCKGRDLLRTAAANAAHLPAGRRMASSKSTNPTTGHTCAGAGPQVPHLPPVPLQSYFKAQHKAHCTQGSPLK